uniref:Uncharacterized protein n=1 Tax=Siphoviridae sp. ctxMM9 TaxID=2827973 RepID=A0A8S5T5W8_9CAUD|nr:MAG TPA: hypothetical protein [Siphoviridae sp. ctxMM9]
MALSLLVLKQMAQDLLAKLAQVKLLLMVIVQKLVVLMEIFILI